MDNVITEKAAEWLLKISSEDPKPTDEDFHAFEHWRNSDVRHAEAVVRMEKLIGSLESLPKKPCMETFDAVVSEKNHKPVSKLISIFAATLVLSFVFYSWQSEKIAYLLADLKTDKTNSVTHVLADSSRLVMASNSAVNEKFNSRLRLVELVDGEIHLDVASDAQRPFVVSTTHGEMRVLGTQFIVSKNSQSTRLSVLESSVAVTIRANTGNDINTVISAGQELEFSQNLQGEIKNINIKQTERSWRKGMLVMSKETLPSVLQQLSERYNSHYFYSESDLQHIDVTAVLPMNDQRAALNLLEETLPIKIEQKLKFIKSIKIKEE